MFEYFHAYWEILHRLVLGAFNKRHKMKLHDFLKGAQFSQLRRVPEISLKWKPLRECFQPLSKYTEHERRKLFQGYLILPQKNNRGFDLITCEGDTIIVTECKFSKMGATTRLSNSDLLDKHKKTELELKSKWLYCFLFPDNFFQELGIEGDFILIIVAFRETQKNLVLIFCPLLFTFS
jgi:hypothetical protein